MSTTINQAVLPAVLREGQSGECPTVGEFARLAEEGGVLLHNRCRCERCIGMLTEAIVNANFARRMRGEEKSGLNADSVPTLRVRVDPPLGRGGQGSVYFGVDMATTTCVAVKVLARERACDVAAITRLLHEALWLDTLAGEGLVSLYLVGVTRDGLPFLATKYIEGPSLREVIDQEANLPHTHDERARWALRLVSRLLVPLARMHATSIIHRDIKPANVVLEHGSHPILLDLGIATAFGSEFEGPPRAAFTGSVSYAAPERLRFGDAVNAPTVDVYAMGVLLGELIGTRFGRARTASRRFDDLREVIARATREDPAERYPDANAMLAAVRASLAQFDRAPGATRRTMLVGGLLMGGALIAGSLHMTGNSISPNTIGPAKLTPRPGPSSALPVPAFSPRDQLEVLRSQWISTARDQSPTFEAALHDRTAATLFFSAIDPLMQWGYCAGETMPGQVTAVALDPLELAYRSGKDSVTLYDPVTRATREFHASFGGFPRCRFAPSGRFMLVFNAAQNYAIVDRETLATRRSGMFPAPSGNVPTLSDDGVHLARLLADGTIMVAGADDRWKVFDRGDRMSSLLAFCGSRLLVFNSIGEVASHDLASGNVVRTTLAKNGTYTVRANVHASSAIASLSNGEIWSTTDAGVTWFPLKAYITARDTTSIVHDPNAGMVFSQGIGRSLGDTAPVSVHSGFLRVVTAARDRDGRVLVTHGRTWRLIDPAAHAAWKFIDGSQDAYMAYWRKGEQQFFAGSSGIWSATLGTDTRTQLSPMPTSNIAVDLDRQTILSGGYEGHAAAYDAVTGRTLWQLDDPARGTCTVAMSGDLAFVGGNDGSLSTFGVRTGNPIWTATDHRYRVRCVHANTQFVTAASASPGIVTYLHDGTKHATCRLADGRCVAISRDGQVILAGSDRGTVAVARTSASTPETEISAHTGGVWSVAINPTGKIGASGGGDGVVRLWWLRPLTPLAEFRISAESAQAIYSLHFSEDSRRLSCSVDRFGAVDIDLAQHERALEDWMTRDRAVGFMGATRPTANDVDVDSTTE
ncbi:MAG: serine/threonine-protein kinase [Planctomycetota bacterium]|nr:serine/threonine-protein kinase [Planctomycetota bacterium]